jgi:chromatin structure-remodeling complex subunit RSC1/2
LHCQHPHTEDIDEYSDNMASGRAPSSTPVPTTETAESAGATSTVSAAEWEAMSGFLKNIYDYRDAE